MHLAISILTSELESYRRCAREELKYSVYPEYRGPNEDFGKNILELQQAIEHLQGCGTHAAANNSGYTGAKPPQMPSWEIAIKDVVFNTREERDIAATVYENVARHFA